MDGSGAAVWVPRTLTAALCGEAVEVRRMTVRQVLAVNALMDGRSLLSLVPDAKVTSVKDLLQLLPSLLQKDGETLIALLSAASGQTEDRLKDSDAAELLEFAGAVLETNLDFFSQRLAPAIAQAISRVASRSRGAGPTPSKP